MVMATEISRMDRLLRKRNRCLQHQLHLRVQIMDKEFKMTRTRVNKDIYDCNSFYKTLQGIYPGLENYSVPDTKSMFLHNKELKQQTATSRKEKRHAARGTVGDSRHIARAGQSQIQSSIYSTFFQSEKENHSTSEKPLVHITDIVKQLEEERDAADRQRPDNKKKDPEQAWRRSNTCLAATLTSSSNDTTQNGDGNLIHEHPIATLVRTMRERIGSAPPTRKVLFNPTPESPITDRPKTAGPVTTSQNDVTKPTSKYSNSRQVERNVRPASTTTCAREFEGVKDVKSMARPKTAFNDRSSPRKVVDASSSDRSSPRKVVDPSSKPISSPKSPSRCRNGRDTNISPDKATRIEYIKKLNRHTVTNKDHIRRPKSAPPIYELLGKSPALPRQQVAGIMAEMESRRAATRALIEKSRLIQKQVKKITSAQGIASDDDDSD